MKKFLGWLMRKLGLAEIHTAPQPTGGPKKLRGAAETKFVPYGKNDRPKGE